MANEMETLNVRGRVIEDALRCEVVETGLLRLELKADKRKALAVYHPNGRIGPKSLR